MLCYTLQTIDCVSSQVSPFLTCYIFQTIVDCSSSIIIAYVQNQFRGHWLLSDVVNFPIITSYKLKEQVGIALALYQLLDDDFGVVLELFTFNIKKEMCDMLDSFLSFKKRYEEKKTHNDFIDVRFTIKKFSFDVFICLL